MQERAAGEGARPGMRRTSHTQHLQRGNVKSLLTTARKLDSLRSCNLDEVSGLLMPAVSLHPAQDALHITEGSLGVVLI